MMTRRKVKCTSYRSVQGKMSSLLSYYCLINALFASFDFILPQRLPFLLVSAFNIDEEFPIVITNKFNRKNAHFGASVLLLPKSPTGHETDVTGWVLIGAPKANSTHANHTDIFEPGVIWRCSLGPVPTGGGRDLCEIVRMDPTGEYDPRDRALPFSDRKDGSWLGGSMFAGESDHFVACASRWINKKYTDLFLLNGMCYWLPKNNLMVDSRDDPNWPWLAPKLSYRLSPLLNGTMQYRKINDSSQQVDKTVTYLWAFGQFGFSLHLTPKNEMIVGAVGILDWTGGLVYFRDRLGPRSQFRSNNSHAGSPAFSEVVVVQSDNLPGTLQSSDYFGYSVTSGKFFHEWVAGNKTQFAAGAPRASHLSGKVLIFTVAELEEGRSEGVLELIAEPIEGNETTKGNHYGSYFGQALLALDVNGDGFDDLLVGAPLYGASIRFKRNAVPESAPEVEKEEEETAKMKSGDEGCVFVYWSTGEDFVRIPQALCGDKIPGARFGFAITSLKDINYDGYNDVSVGAPYENEGRGAVYIFHGGDQFLTLAQKLQPESIDKRIRTFGSSLSLGVDIDDNGYPDLAVGAYETNQVLIYRTIPIVKFEAILTASIPKLLSTTGEFNMTSCIAYSGHGNIPTSLGIWVKLTAEVELEGKRLVSFLHDDFLATRSNTTLLKANRAPLLVHSIKRLMFVRKDDELSSSCYNFTMFRTGNVDGPTRTVSIRQDYWIKGYEKEQGDVKPVHYVITERQPNRDPYHVPVVNLSSSKSEFVNFSHTKLLMPAGKRYGKEKFNLPVGTICEADGDPECKANLTINAFLVDYKSRQIYSAHNPFILGSVDMLTLTVELFNHRETANLPITLSLHWLEPPNVRRLPSNCDHIGGGDFSCSIRRPIKEMQREAFTIELDMSKAYGQPNDRHMDIHLEATTSSELVKECKLHLSIPMRTNMQPQNFSHAGSRIEYAPGNESIPTFGISQAFEVGLDGPSAAAALRVDFIIPMKIEVDGKLEELFALRRPIVAFDGEFFCSSPTASFLDEGQAETTFSKSILPTSVNSGENDDEIHIPLHEDTSSTMSEATKILWGKVRRGKRSILSSKEPFNFNLNGETLTLSCEDSSPKRKLACRRVTCILYRFNPQKKAVIELKLRMFNKVAFRLLKSENDLRDEDISTLMIQGVGRVQTLDSRWNPFGVEGRIKFTSRLGIPPPYELPAWILIVSVAGGLLSLTLIIVVLKKCGFFRRSKRDEMMLHRKAVEMRMRGAQNLPGTSSTIRVRTSSSRKRRNSNASNSRSLQKKRSFRQAKEAFPSPDIDRVSMSRSTSRGNQRNSSIVSSSLSPSTIAKQREIPGAVDLTELRRLYAYADEDELY